MLLLVQVAGFLQEQCQVAKNSQEEAAQSRAVEQSFIKAEATEPKEAPHAHAVMANTEAILDAPPASSITDAAPILRRCRSARRPWGPWRPWGLWRP